MYALLALACSILLLVASRALITPWPPVDRLRLTGSWVLLSVALRQLYQAVRIAEQHHRSFPFWGYVTEAMVFVSLLVFVVTWARRGGRGTDG